MGLHKRDVPLIRPTREGRTGDSQALPTGDVAGFEFEDHHYDDIQSLVISDIEKRRNVGIERYGQALQPNNGRNALLDAYEEVLDLLCYLRQRMVEEELNNGE